MHSTIDSTIHPRHFNSLEDCICTTTMINIRPYRESNLVPSRYRPKSIRMSQWVGPRDKPGYQIYLPSRHKALAQCCADVSPLSTTLAQHEPNIGTTTRVCWTADFICDVPHRHPIYVGALDFELRPCFVKIIFFG